MSLMDSAMRCLAAGGQTVVGLRGVYRRKDGKTATLTVTRAQSDREQTADRGLINIVGSDDILVTTAAFEAAFGACARPYDGDVWEADGRVYRVRPLGGEPAWRKSGPGDVRLRIHLKDERPTL